MSQTLGIAHLHDDKHDLTHVEGVSPVVVGNVAVVLSHCQDPATKRLQIGQMMDTDRNSQKKKDTEVEFGINRF